MPEDQLPEFMKAQIEFTAYLRNHEPSNLNKLKNSENAHIYHKLIHNNVDEILQGAFPILYSIIPEMKWKKLIAKFIKEHSSSTPLFFKIPEEFVHYLTKKNFLNDYPPFLIELAHFEWVELELDIANESIHEDEINPDGDLFNDIPVLSPLLELLSYQYPVHKINQNFIPNHPLKEPLFILAYRDRNDHVGFIEANALTAKLVELLNNNTHLTGKNILMQIANELKTVSPELIEESGKKILHQLREHDIILGTRRN